MRNNRSARCVAANPQHYSRPANSEVCTSAPSDQQPPYGPMAEPVTLRTADAGKSAAKTPSGNRRQQQPVNGQKEMVNPSRQARNHRHALPGGTVQPSTPWSLRHGEPGPARDGERPARHARALHRSVSPGAEMVGTSSRPPPSPSGRVWRSYGGPHPVHPDPKTVADFMGIESVLDTATGAPPEHRRPTRHCCCARPPAHISVLHVDAGRLIRLDERAGVQRRLGTGKSPVPRS